MWMNEWVKSKCRNTQFKKVCTKLFSVHDNGKNSTSAEKKKKRNLHPLQGSTPGPGSYGHKPSYSFLLPLKWSQIPIRSLWNPQNTLRRACKISKFPGGVHSDPPQTIYSMGPTLCICPGPPQSSWRPCLQAQKVTFLQYLCQTTVWWYPSRMAVSLSMQHTHKHLAKPTPAVLYTQIAVTFKFLHVKIASFATVKPVSM